jgi:hypothetical protein
MGSLNWEDIESLYDSSSVKTRGWEISPLVRLNELEELRSHSESPVPSDFYEVLLFRVFDLLSMKTNTTFLGQQVRTGVYVHMSIIPSFQIRQSVTVSLDGSGDRVNHLFSILTEIAKDLNAKANALGLTPTMTISKIQLRKSSRRDDVESKLKDGIKIYIESNQTITKSASQLGDTIAIKFLEGQFEHYVIFDFGPESGLTVDYLYLHMIGKSAVRSLQRQIGERLERIVKFDDDSIKFHSLDKVTPSTVKGVSEFRWRVLKETQEFRKLHDRSDLALSFIDFHSNRRFEALDESQFIPGLGQVLKSEIQDTNLFYIQPLNSLLQRTEQVLSHIQESVTSLVEVFTAMVNLRSQKLIERLQFLSIAVAITAVVIAILPWLLGAHP